jgi:malate dehydrogenase
VPVKLGANGIEQLIELKLNEAEMALLNDSADQVRQVMEVYDGLSK